MLVTNVLCSFLLPVLPVKDELEKLSEKFKADDDGSPPIVLCSEYTRIPWFFCILKWMVKKGSKDRQRAESALQNGSPSPPKPSHYPSNPYIWKMILQVF